ncbi:GNAT family N-acetyltransferase [Vallitalea okinawensis]|uniref:GNAT family N-acetyltransferase n=1 Tax=Vallitalea okinawensis TaxID=2078660 RepID=UPI000CFAD28D|nr:GNAT family N-acetyltransferase [Vallitalea okinawensis]
MLYHKGTQTIETERLKLRRFTVKDAEDMYNNWANDDKVTECLSWPTHKSIDTTRKILESWMESYDKDDTYSWAITYKEDNIVIGSIGVVSLNNQHESCSIGYCIGRNFWGRGITTEAFKEIIQFLLYEVGFERIEAYHHTDNPASGNVMKKAGLLFEGTLRHYRKNIRGKFVDCDLYGIIKK